MSRKSFPQAAFALYVSFIRTICFFYSHHIFRLFAPYVSFKSCLPYIRNKKKYKKYSKKYRAREPRQVIHSSKSVIFQPTILQSVINKLKRTDRKNKNKSPFRVGSYLSTIIMSMRFYRTLSIPS